MSTTTPSSTHILTGPTRFLISFTDLFVKDIDEAKFADRLGTTVNHPAFVLGHCAFQILLLSIAAPDLILTNAEYFHPLPAVFGEDHSSSTRNCRSS